MVVETQHKVKISADELIELLERHIGDIFEEGKEAYIDAVKMTDAMTIEFTILKD